MGKAKRKMRPQSPWWWTLDNDNCCKRHQENGCVSHATAGEQFVYKFLPSGIVECQTVKCLCCGKEFTDYVD